MGRASKTIMVSVAVLFLVSQTVTASSINQQSSNSIADDVYLMTEEKMETKMSQLRWDKP